MEESENAQQCETVNLFIAKNGEWYNNGVKVIHEKIFELFCRSLRHAAGGGYCLEISGQTCPVEVEDTPFVVRGVFYENDADGCDVFHLTLNDGRTDRLDPTSLRIGPGGDLRCRILSGAFDAAFTHTAMSQIAPYLDHDSYGACFIEANGEKIAITTL